MSKENIRNLTSLWLLTGETFNAIQTISEFKIVNLQFSQWPNRIWSDESLTSNRKAMVKEFIMKYNTEMTLTIFKELNEEMKLDDCNLKISSVQIGMNLSLKEYDKDTVNNSINLIIVKNQTGAKLWSSMFQQSFGYFISDKVIDRIKSKVNFYNIKYNNQFVGTVATYLQNNSIGIHCLGIIPKYRGKGIAEISMIEILSKAQKDNLNYAYLQSSSMGENLYKKLGFNAVFKMFNYKLIK